MSARLEDVMACEIDSEIKEKRYEGGNDDGNE